MAKKLSNTELTDLITSFVRLIKANAMGAQIVGRFPITDLKKGTTKNRSLAYVKFYDEGKGEWNVSKVTTYKNVTFQRSYVNAVENRSDNVMPYVVDSPKGRAWVEGCEGILLQSETDPTKFYLRMSENKNTIRETTYYVGDRPATEEEIAIIKEFSPKRDYVCKKQLNYGVAEDNQVIVKDITLANIVSIKYGDRLLTLR